MLLYFYLNLFRKSNVTCKKKQRGIWITSRGTFGYLRQTTLLVQEIICQPPPYEGPVAHASATATTPFIIFRLYYYTASLNKQKQEGLNPLENR